MTGVRPSVRAVPPPPETGICGLYEGADLADAYAVRLPAPGPHDIRTVAEQALRDPAPWLRAAMRVRDTIVARFRVKTSRQILQNLERHRADRIGFFPVVSRSEHEIILGENDRHLDFRLSLMLRPSDSGERDELVATTVVHCHNRLGRVYLAAILLGHRMAVPSLLRKGAARLRSAGG